MGTFLTFSHYYDLHFQVIKICKIEPPDLLFLVAFISFKISRFHFSQIFRNPFRIIRKKDFPRRFSFLTDSLKPHSPSLNDQNPLSVTKVFRRCPLTVNKGFLSGFIRVRIPQKLGIVDVLESRCRVFLSWILDVAVFWSWNLDVAVFWS